MKKIIFIFAASVLLCLTACAQNHQKQENMKRAIVVYFSATGTTESVARRLAAVTHADTMAIEPAQPYTSADLDWTNNHSRSTLEMKNPKSRPAIKTPEKSLDAYDVVFLGYPIWWDLAPTVVNTFIESQHLDGKVVVPFATSGGSGINHSAVQLKKQYPNIKWREGKLLNAPSDEELAQWVESLGIKAQ